MSVRAGALLDSDTRFGRAFDNLILAQIILSVASVVLEATRPVKAFIFSFQGLVDLIAIAPFLRFKRAAPHAPD